MVQSGRLEQNKNWVMEKSLYITNEIALCYLSDLRASIDAIPDPNS